MVYTHIQGLIYIILQNIMAGNKESPLLTDPDGEQDPFRNQSAVRFPGCGRQYLLA